MEDYQEKWFPIDSVKFIKSVEPARYVLDEDLMAPRWLGSGPLVIVYPTTFPGHFGYDSDGEKFRTDLEETWKKRIKTYNRLTSQDLGIVVKPDIDITHEELNKRSFLIYGTPPSAFFFKYLEQKFPISIEGGKIKVEDRAYDDENLQLVITIPSPLNPIRFWTLVMGTTPHSAMKGLYMVVSRFVWK